MVPLFNLNTCTTFISLMESISNINYVEDAIVLQKATTSITFDSFYLK